MLGESNKTLRVGGGGGGGGKNVNVTMTLIFPMICIFQLDGSIIKSHTKFLVMTLFFFPGMPLYYRMPKIYIASHTSVIKIML